MGGIRARLVPKQAGSPTQAWDMNGEIRIPNTQKTLRKSVDVFSLLFLLGPILANLDLTTSG
jgi:hypothetical protein